MDFTAILPAELSCHIFTFLGQVELRKCVIVSKRWKKHSDDRYIWKLLANRDYKNGQLRTKRRGINLDYKSMTRLNLEENIEYFIEREDELNYPFEHVSILPGTAFETIQRVIANENIKSISFRGMDEALEKYDLCKLSKCRTRPINVWFRFEFERNIMLLLRSCEYIVTLRLDSGYLGCSIKALLRIISNAPKLENLLMGNVRIHGPEITELNPPMPKSALSRLELSCHKYDDGPDMLHTIYLFLLGNNKLSSIACDICRSNVGYYLNHFVSVSEVEELNLVIKWRADNGIGDILNLVRNSKSLRKFTLSATKIKAIDLSTVRDSLYALIAYNMYIVELTLSRIPLGDLIQLISPAILINDTITSLDISSTTTRFTNSNIWDTFARALSMNTTLRKLNISENGIGNNSAVLLMKALIQNKMLFYLDISNNQITDSKLLGELITCNKSIISLDISHNNIKCLDNIFIALGENAHIERLILNGNRIKKSTPLLAEALFKNCTLRKLHMRKCAITVSARFIVPCLFKPSMLWYLDLRDNRISEHVAREIGRALKENPMLGYVLLAGNPDISDVTLDELLSLRK